MNINTYCSLHRNSCTRQKVLTDQMPRSVAPVLGVRCLQITPSSLRGLIDRLYYSWLISNTDISKDPHISRKIVWTPFLFFFFFFFYISTPKKPSFSYI